MVYHSSTHPLSSNLYPYGQLYDYHPFSYPYAQHSINAHYLDAFPYTPYPNTLSTIWPSFHGVSNNLNIDIAELPIIPKSLLEPQTRPDTSGIHDRDPLNPFFYHEPEIHKSDISVDDYPMLDRLSGDMFAHFFGMPNYYHDIFPDGRITTLETFYRPPSPKQPFDQEVLNEQIYAARKARGDEIVYDVLGQQYVPESEANTFQLNLDTDIFLNDSFDTNQINSYLDNLLSNRNALTSANTSPIRQSGNPLYDVQPLNNFSRFSNYMPMSMNNMSNIIPVIGLPQLTQSFRSQQQFPNVYEQFQPTIFQRQPTALSYPFDNRLPQPYDQNNLSLTDVFADTYPSEYDSETSPYKPSEFVDFSGTVIGEYYHMMEYMQKSFAEITKEKVPFMTFDGRAIPQQFASYNLTGGVPYFDPLSEGYDWMNTSPYYQQYLDEHVLGEHGGIHDVFSPRGFHPRFC